MLPDTTIIGFMFSNFDLYINGVISNTDCELISQFDLSNYWMINFFKGVKYTRKYCIEAFLSNNDIPRKLLFNPYETKVIFSTIQSILGQK